MDRREALKLSLLALFAAFQAAPAAAQVSPPKPGPRDACPVCGMLVSKYTNWVATIVYKDGHAHHFDGAKDMFKFWFDPPRYAANHSRDIIASIWVTDYYSLQKIDARKAYYVTGSDVLGPMGHEFVALASKADAEDFMKEHKGKQVLTFDQVSTDLPARIDDGHF